VGVGVVEGEDGRPEVHGDRLCVCVCVCVSVSVCECECLSACEGRDDDSGGARGGEERQRRNTISTSVV